MATSLKATVHTRSHTQLAKVSFYIRDFREAWDVQVREIVQGRKELGLNATTAGDVVLSYGYRRQKENGTETTFS